MYLVVNLWGVQFSHTTFGAKSYVFLAGNVVKFNVLKISRQFEFVGAEFFLAAKQTAVNLGVTSSNDEKYVKRIPIKK